MSRSATIAALNDALRTTFQGGRVMMTRGTAELPEPTREKVLAAVRGFSAFSAENDPYGEHDFGAVEVEGVRCFFKVDYYDSAMEYGSEDPADPQKTTRVLPIMLAEEY